MRRTIVLLATVVLVLAGCGSDGGLPRLSVDGRTSTSVLRLADGAGVSLLDTDAAEVTTWIRGGVRSRDWVFQSRLTAAGTSVDAVSPLGEVAWSADLDGDVAARVASSDGSLVALLPYGDAHVDPYHPEGRTSTELTVLATDGSGERTYDLDGNFEPEAFSTSGTSLFVIEYVPPEAPDRYRVRKLDLDSGEIGPVYSVDGHLQESMRGTARVQAMSADGSRLYTLYTTDAGGVHGEATAFVHVLDLDEEWAHCVDLPAPIGSSPEQLLAIAADPAGGRVLVVDLFAGVAEVDAAELRVTNSALSPVGSGDPGRAFAVVDRHGSLVVAQGDDIQVFDANLAPIAYAVAPTITVGLHLDPVDSRVWLVGADAVYALDPSTGVVEQSVALPDEVPEPDVPSAVDMAPIQCAC
jgi:hypothetical protein